MLQPFDPVLSHGDKVEGRGDDREKECAEAKDCRTAICPPCSATVDEEAPDGESDGEDEEEG